MRPAPTVTASPVATLALSALRSTLTGEAEVEHALKLALRRGGREGVLPCNAARASVASAVFGVSALRARLAFLLDTARREHAVQNGVANIVVAHAVVTHAAVAQKAVAHEAFDREGGCDAVDADNADNTYDADAAGEVANALKRKGVPVEPLMLALFLLYEEPQRVSRQDMSIWLPVDSLGLTPSTLEWLLASDPARAAAWPKRAVPSTAVRFSLPCGLVRRWSRALPPTQLDSLADCCNAPARVTLRVNAALTNREAVFDRLRISGVDCEMAKLSSWGIHLKGGRESRGGSVWSLPGWTEGEFELQDEGSQCIALACDVRPGDTVLDLCAGNGGKTLALASLVGEHGKVLAYDINAGRLKQLAASASRARVSDRVEVLWDAEALARVLDVDVVLVDAPCSSSGVLRRHPSLRWSGQWASDAARKWPRIQLSLLREACWRVRVGGKLVYATCALEREQNEQVADAFSDGAADGGGGAGGGAGGDEGGVGVGGSSERAGSTIGEGQVSPVFRPFAFAENVVGRHAAPTHYRTLWPHLHGTDGFFVSRWVRES